jgi:hypothetical protein
MHLSRAFAAAMRPLQIADHWPLIHTYQQRAAHTPAGTRPHSLTASRAALPVHPRFPPPLSPAQTCYLRAVDDCYNGTVAKVAKLAGKGPAELTVESAFDSLIFHSPYNKLVQQSFRRLMFNDARRLKQNHVALPAHLAPVEPFVDLPYEKTLTSKDLDKALAVRGAVNTVAWRVTATVGRVARG